MGTFGSWRRAFGAIKDSTTISLAKCSSDFKNLDIAIVKATNHEECPPKDLHVRRIIVSTSFSVPRADVGYCIHTLSRRLMKTRNWIVAVKTLMVLHRILREGDPSFREELFIHSRRRKLYHIPEFRDESSQLASDCSLFLRNYCSFLEERLATAPQAYSRSRLMTIDELLDQLPVMQQLLHRVIACQPAGAAYHNSLIQHALALVLKESLEICYVISNGIIDLLELFFNLSKEDAENALNIYKKAGKQAEELADFYNIGKHMQVVMNVEFPTLMLPPPSFVETMEEYIKVLSSNGSVSNMEVEHPHEVEQHLPPEIKEVVKREVVQDQKPESKHLPKVEEVLPLIVIDDNNCQGLDETTKNVAEWDDSKASSLRLAVIQPDKTSSCKNESEKTSNWWELAVITSPSKTNNNHNTTSQAKPGGGFDQRKLYSLYEDHNMTNKQIQNMYDMQHGSFHHNYHPLQQQDHFMDMQHQQQFQNQYQQQQNMPMTCVSYTNPGPFGDGIHYPQGNHGLM